MAKTISHPLSQPTKWRQYEDIDHALADHKRRLRRLQRLGKIAADDGLLDCRKGCCGLGSEIPADRETSPSPYPCSAMCRVAQIRLERIEAPRLADILSPLDPSPLFVTVTSPSYWLAPEQLPQFEVSGIIQSIKRRLTKAAEVSGKMIVAVGRVDFDLGCSDSGEVVVRPHVHLAVAGSDKQTLTTHLRHRYNRKAYPTIKPVVIEPVRDKGALRYTLKCRLGGLTNQGDAPPDLKHARQRLIAMHEALFDEFLLKHKIRELLILFRIRKNGNNIELLNDKTKDLKQWYDGLFASHR